MTDPNANRPGYKETKVGWIPEEWECVPLGALFTESKEKGEAGHQTYSVTMDRGLIPRGELDRKMAPDLPPDQSLMVRAGDVVYNMMRMWQGSVALAECDCVVSPAYVVCKPREEVSSDFYLLYFKSFEGLYRLWRYSYGVTNDRLRLYFPDFSLVPAPRPPYPEQTKIAEILSANDRVIERTEALIAAKRRQKRALMQQLLTGKRRLAGFDGDWSQVCLGEVFRERKEINRNHSKLLAVTSGKGIVPADTLDKKDSSSSDKSKYKYIRKGDLGYNTMRMWQGVSDISKYDGIVSPAYTVCIPSKELDGPFIAHLFKLPEIINLFWRYSQGLVDDTLNLKFNNFSLIKIKLPDRNEQSAISNVLDTADREIETLESKLAALRRQKQALMQRLLTGRVRVESDTSDGSDWSDKADKAKKTDGIRQGEGST